VTNPNDKGFGPMATPDTHDGTRRSRVQTIKTRSGLIVHQLVTKGRVVVEATDPRDVQLWLENLSITGIRVA